MSDATYITVNTWDPVDGVAPLWLNLRHVVSAKTAVWEDEETEDEDMDPTPDPTPKLWLKLSTGDTVFVFLTLSQWQTTLGSVIGPAPLPGSPLDNLLRE